MQWRIFACWPAHPEARAADLKDPAIQGIVSTIGGDDSNRMLPFLDYSQGLHRLLRLSHHPLRIFESWRDAAAGFTVAYSHGQSTPRRGCAHRIWQNRGPDLPAPAILGDQQDRRAYRP
ncbi:LD-carboxypeptidase [Edaphobacter bradus]|uniref:LD-carboxypeptidase n=1 Tax=Edaphobacter bradus TaxID=2259016 RepID=UPI0037BEDF07